MELKIGNRDYPIYLGIAAIDYLDNFDDYRIEQNGMSFGFGVNMLYGNLEMGNVSSLVRFIKAGTCTEKQKPSNKAIEEFMAELDYEGLKALFEEAIDELKKQPMTRLSIARLEEAQTEENSKKKD